MNKVITDELIEDCVMFSQEEKDKFFGEHTVYWNGKYYNYKDYRMYKQLTSKT